MDIDACAAANTSEWGRRSNSVVAANTAVASFRTAAGHAAAGINVIASKLLHFLTQGQVTSTYQFAADREGTAKAEKMYETAMGQARLAFEAAIGAPRSVTYATLDLPGACGDVRYGPFRLVLDPAGDVAAAVVLPHNSATGYSGAGGLDESAVCSDAARWEERGAVATVRRGEAAASMPPADWPALLASEDDAGPVDFDSVEVVLRQPARPMTDVGTIRISEGHHRDLSKEYGRALATPAIPPTELVAAFGELLNLADAGRLALEIVA